MHCFLQAPEPEAWDRANQHYAMKVHGLAIAVEVVQVLLDSSPEGSMAGSHRVHSSLTMI